MEQENNEMNFLRDDGSICLLKDIKKVLQELYDHFRAVKLNNEFLRKENERLKSEAYKDEEMTKMKEKYDKMKKDYYRGFPISEKENKSINEWIEKQTEGDDFKKKVGGAIGGRFTYEFYSTSIGTSGTIIDNITGEKFTFRELG